MSKDAILEKTEEKSKHVGSSLKLEDEQIEDIFHRAEKYTFLKRIVLDPYEDVAIECKELAALIEEIERFLKKERVEQRTKELLLSLSELSQQAIVGEFNIYFWAD